jgi:hypothetical protein
MVWLSNTSGHETSENNIIQDYLFFSYTKSEPIYKIKRNGSPCRPGKYSFFVFGIYQVQISVQRQANLSRILIFRPSPIKEIKKQ